MKHRKIVLAIGGSSGSMYAKLLVPREAPYSLIHLRNMTAITEAGGIICPATPSFYSKPQNVEEVCATVVDRVVDLADLPQDTYRWGE